MHRFYVIPAKNGNRQSNNVGLSQSLKNVTKKPFVRPFEDDYGNNEASINTEFKSNLITNEMVDTNVTTIERSCKEETSELLNINNNVIVQDKKLLKVSTMYIRVLDLLEVLKLA